MENTFVSQKVKSKDPTHQQSSREMGPNLTAEPRPPPRPVRGEADPLVPQGPTAVHKEPHDPCAVRKCAFERLSTNVHSGFQANRKEKHSIVPKVRGP